MTPVAARPTVRGNWWIAGPRFLGVIPRTSALHAMSWVGRFRAAGNHDVIVMSARVFAPPTVEIRF